ncbi:hypothetical protein Tco_1292914 [Tanacetum coccineum]
MNNRREHHTRAYLSLIEDSKASNVLPSNHRGCLRLEGLGMFFRETIDAAQGYKVKDAKKAILKTILKKGDGLETTFHFSDAALRTSLLYVTGTSYTCISISGRGLHGEECFPEKPSWVLKARRREHHARAYLSPVEDSRARNVLLKNHRGCSRLQGEERKRSNP